VKSVTFLLEIELFSKAADIQIQTVIHEGVQSFTGAAPQADDIPAASEVGEEYNTEFGHKAFGERNYLL
jgi:hypothetical protein